jgi:hypothetical protein
VRAPRLNTREGERGSAEIRSCRCGLMSASCWPRRAETPNTQIRVQPRPLRARTVGSTCILERLFILSRVLPPLMPLCSRAVYTKQKVVNA